MRVLHDISEKEMNQQPLEQKEIDFLKYTVEGAGFGSGMSLVRVSVYVTLLTIRSGAAGTPNCIIA